jgi:hypothetical protein
VLEVTQQVSQHGVKVGHGNVVGPVTRLRTQVIACATLAVLVMFAVITAVPAAAGAETPPWVAGLRSAVSIDSGGAGRATSWGSTIKVVGAYLDDQRTIIVVARDHASTTPLPNAFLVAAGRRYNMNQVVSSDDGFTSIEFPPLPVAWSAAVPVVLHLADGPVLPPHVWTLNFSLGPRAKEAGSVLEQGRAGEMEVTFSGVSMNEGSLTLRFAETGVSYDQVVGPARTTVEAQGITASVRGPVAVHVQVFDQTGRPQRWLDTKIMQGPGASVTISAVFLQSSPGPYRIEITAPSGAKLERIVGA